MSKEIAKNSFKETIKNNTNTNNTRVSPLANFTQEQQAEFRARAAAERQAKIDAAIKKGARVQYVSVPISGEEQETIMIRTPSGETVIDTTVSKDITRCLKAGYPIKGITYYEDKASDKVSGKASGVSRVVGLRCEFVKRGVVSI